MSLITLMPPYYPPKISFFLTPPSSAAGAAHLLADAALLQKALFGTLYHTIEHIVQLMKESYGDIADCFRGAFAAFININLRRVMYFRKTAHCQSATVIFIPQFITVR